MQGNELCLKAQHMSYSGTWCLNEIQSHLWTTVLFEIETVFTLLIHKRKKMRILCTCRAQRSNSASQAAEPAKQCVF